MFVKLSRCIRVFSFSVLVEKKYVVDLFLFFYKIIKCEMTLSMSH